jgi:hypothetical protein
MLRSLDAHGAGQGLQRTDLDRLTRCDLHATDGVAAFKGWSCSLTASQQGSNE